MYMYHFTVIKCNNLKFIWRRGQPKEATSSLIQNICLYIEVHVYSHNHTYKEKTLSAVSQSEIAFAVF